MKNIGSNLGWKHVILSDGHSLICTENHIISTNKSDEIEVQNITDDRLYVSQDNKLVECDIAAINDIGMSHKDIDSTVEFEKMTTIDLWNKYQNFEKNNEIIFDKPKRIKLGEEILYIRKLFKKGDGVIARFVNQDDYNYSYDMETESSHFDVNGIYTHNCRSFLQPYYEDKNGNPSKKKKIVSTQLVQEVYDQTKEFEL